MGVVAGVPGDRWRTPYEDFVGVAVAPGVWCTALPFPSPLRSSFSYLVRTEDGVVVVDLGWDTDEGWLRFLAGLDRAGIALNEVTGVVVTHLHPDHHGLAGRLQQSSDAWVAFHPGERPALTLDDRAAAARIEQMAQWLRACGAPATEVRTLEADAAEIAAGFCRKAADVDLADGVPLEGSARSLTVIHTPGHTPGHVCIHDRDRGLIFTGDHVLPRITPNISKRPTSDEDPLRDYTSSLRRLAHLDGAGPVQVLPGHEWGFGCLSERLDGIEQHHVERLAEMEAAVSAGARTVWEVSQMVAWSRPFSSLGPRARRSAIGETHSHLFRLHASGRLNLIAGEPDRWSPQRLGPDSALTTTDSSLPAPGRQDQDV